MDLLTILLFITFVYSPISFLISCITYLVYLVLPGAIPISWFFIVIAALVTAGTNVFYTLEPILFIVCTSCIAFKHTMTVLDKNDELLEVESY